MPDSVYYFAYKDEEIPIVIVAKRGLRNVTMRPKVVPEKQINISKPWMVPDKYVLQFVEQKSRWLERIFQKVPEKVSLQEGDFIDFLGKKILIKHDSNLRSNKFLSEESTLIVGGDKDLMESRVREFIKKQLLYEIKAIIKTTPKEYWPRRIALRDTCTRWGSCSSTGTMSFSWRLAFAPYEVMRYVVMHEVAHRKYMDHSPDFWHQVSVLYGFGVERAKRWLAQHGAELHKYC